MIGKPVVIRSRLVGVKDKVFFPAPITVKDCLDGIQFSLNPNAEEKQVQEETKRMFAIWERWRAFMQPIMFNGKLHWTVIFGTSGKWENGPMRDNAGDAMQANYTLNKMFRGEQALSRGDGMSPFRVDEVIDQALKEQDKANREAAIEDNLRAGQGQSGQGLILPGDRRWPAGN